MRVSFSGIAAPLSRAELRSNASPLPSLDAPSSSFSYNVKDSSNNNISNCFQYYINVCANVDPNWPPLSTNCLITYPGGWCVRVPV